MAKCSKCGKSLNPVQAMIAQGRYGNEYLCQECVRKAHKETVEGT